MPDDALPAARVDIYGLSVTGVAGTRNMMGQDKTATRLAPRDCCCPDGWYGVVTGSSVVGGKFIVLQVHEAIGCIAHSLFGRRVDERDRPSCCECTSQRAGRVAAHTH